MNFEQYTNIPHAQMNCLALVQFVLGREFGRKLDVPSHADLLTVHEQAFPERAGAMRADSPDVGDVVLFDRKPYAHVGLLIGGGYVLHSLEEDGSRIDRLAVLSKRMKIEGYYRAAST
jgi:cell wall-associated NlpC family hydrolase